MVKSDSIMYPPGPFLAVSGLSPSASVLSQPQYAIDVERGLPKRVRATIGHHPWTTPVEMFPRRRPNHTMTICLRPSCVRQTTTSLGDLQDMAVESPKKRRLVRTRNHGSTIRNEVR